MRVLISHNEVSIFFVLSSYFGSFSVWFIIFFDVDVSERTYKRSLIEISADENWLLKMFGLLCSRTSAAETISHIFALTFIWYNGLFVKRQAEHWGWTDWENRRNWNWLHVTRQPSSVKVSSGLEGIDLISGLVDSCADKIHVTHSYSPGVWLSRAKRFDSDTENRPMKK